MSSSNLGTITIQGQTPCVWTAAVQRPHRPSPTQPYYSDNATLARSRSGAIQKDASRASRIACERRGHRYRLGRVPPTRGSPTKVDSHPCDAYGRRGYAEWRHGSDRGGQPEASANKRESPHCGGLDARPAGVRGRLLIGPELALKLREELLWFHVLPSHFPPEVVEFLTRGAELFVLYEPDGLPQKAVVIQSRVLGDEEFPSDCANKAIVRPGDLSSGNRVKLEIRVQGTVRGVGRHDFRCGHLAQCAASLQLRHEVTVDGICPCRISGVVPATCAAIFSIGPIERSPEVLGPVKALNKAVLGTASKLLEDVKLVVRTSGRRPMSAQRLRSFASGTGMTSRSYRITSVTKARGPR